MKIAVDAMGGDYAPEQIVIGAIQAAKKFSCEITLVGDENKIKSILNNEKDWQKLPLTIRHTSEVVEMGEHPADAVRNKKDSSIVVATELVKAGMCDAVLSAGSTGAAVTAAQLILKRIHGIGRPAIATPIPTPKGVTLLLDSGANVDSKPEHLVQTGIMGSLYAEHVFGKKNPSVGLLNIGEEESKGNEQVKATYQLLKELKTINFIGNAEGRDIPKGHFDVVLCDGFVGNVVLKFAEGLAKTILKLIKEAVEEGGVTAKVGALLLTPTLKKLGKRLDASEYGGAPLLGVNGYCVIAHGSSNAKAICSAIGAANDYVHSNILEHIKNSIDNVKSEKVLD
ncbi:MAG: phosphate acyltransferase PlsX [Selenomonadaceae bacterium]|nr:phosphate acyltransferase PlsX [Selenomonadaceae bacterium]